MATPVSVDQIYSLYDVITDHSSDGDKRESAFLNLLSGIKGGDKEKRLSSQFISRFFKDFKPHQESSFNCLLDLCDDQNVDIRKQAVHDLRVICKYEPSFVTRVSNILAQMLQTDDHSEMSVVALSLSHLLHQDPRSTLEGIFGYLLSDNIDQNRTIIIKYLADRLKTLSDAQVIPALEEFVSEQTNALLLTASDSEFIPTISLLASLRSFSNVTGRQRLVDTISEHVRRAAPNLLRNVHAGDFYDYLMDYIIPELVKLCSLASFDCLRLVRLIAQLAQHPPPIQKDKVSDIPGPPNALIRTRLLNAFSLVEVFLPALPLDNELEKTTQSVTGHNQVNPDLQISELEAILFIVRELGRPLSSLPVSEIGKDFENLLKTTRPRLQYLARKVQERINKTSGYVNDEGGSKHDRDSKAAVMEYLPLHKSLRNVHLLTIGLFRNPPSFKPICVALSWLPSPAAASIDIGTSATAFASRTCHNEPVDVRTINRFRTRHKPYGFRGVSRRGIRN